MGDQKGCTPHKLVHEEGSQCPELPSSSSVHPPKFSERTGAVRGGGRRANLAFWMASWCRFPGWKSCVHGHRQARWGRQEWEGADYGRMEKTCQQMGSEEVLFPHFYRKMRAWVVGLQSVGLGSGLPRGLWVLQWVPF